VLLEDVDQMLQIVFGLEEGPADLLIARRGNGLALGELQGSQPTRGRDRA
jgi:hypothetical protein